MKKYTPKTRVRVLILGICFILSGYFCIYNLLTYGMEIIRNNKEVAALESEYNISSTEEEKYKEEIEKLQDPEYFARYTREKYLYSADDEIIIKLGE